MEKREGGEIDTESFVKERMEESGFPRILIPSIFRMFSESEKRKEGTWREHQGDNSSSRGPCGSNQGILSLR